MNYEISTFKNIIAILINSFEISTFKNKKIMDRDQLDNLISCGFSQRDIAEGLGTSHNKVKYWLKKHNLSTNYRKKDALPDRKVCPVCKTDKPNSEFYKRKNRFISQ